MSSSSVCFGTLRLKRVEAEDAEMGILNEWVSTEKEEAGLASEISFRVGAEIAKCNARMISRSQNIIAGLDSE